MDKLKDKDYLAEYLTKAFQKDDPINLQCALLDVIKAQGGYHQVAAKSQINEWKLKLMLWDDDECYRVLRTLKLLKSMGLKVILIPE